VWSATAQATNPTLPADYLIRMEQDDPEAYRSEVLGEFRAGLATLLDPEALEPVVASGVRERAVSRSFVDGPCGGRPLLGRDRRAVAGPSVDPAAA